MGLDMYLTRYPRFEDVTPQQVNAIEALLSWKHRPKEYRRSSLEQWSGVKKEDLPSKEAIDFYTPLYIKRYSVFDDDRQFGYERIDQEVGYWRKANAIHRWFVENIQDGEDDCDYHREVTAEDLEELRDLCIEVVTGCPLIVGKIQNGYRFVNGKEVPIMVDGLMVMNPEYAAERLPTQDGFFFGMTGYDEFYINDLKETIDICNRALAETDFSKDALYYHSSW